MDMRVPFACVLVLGGLLALVMPAFTDEAAMVSVPATEASDGSGGPGQLASLNTSTDTATWAHDIALERQRDGHFYADVAVDGITSRMMVDTGASVIALTGDDARAMGLYWDDSEVGPVAQGASGVVYGVNTRLAHVRLGNFEAEDVQAMIIPEGLGISLLGQSFLSTVNSVEIADDQMVLASQ